MPIDVTDFSIHVCGEVSTTTSLSSGTTPSELAGSTTAGAAGSTTAGAAGTTPTTICSLINLLDRDDTVISTEPESTGERPGRGTFTITPTDENPEPKIIVRPATPTTVMGVTIKGKNIASVTVVYKDGDGQEIETVTLDEEEDVCDYSFYYEFHQETSPYSYHQFYPGHLRSTRNKP